MTDSKKIDDGGPAFQAFRQHALGSVEEVHPGMSLRAYYGGMALSGLVQIGKPITLDPWITARMALKYADALIAALKAGDA